QLTAPVAGHVLVCRGRLGEQRGRPEHIEQCEGREQQRQRDEGESLFRDDRVHDCSSVPSLSGGGGFPPPALRRRPPSPAIASTARKGSFPGVYLSLRGPWRMQEGAVPVRAPGHCMSSRRRSSFLAPFLTALGVFALLHLYVAERLFVAPALP